MFILQIAIGVPAAAPALGGALQPLVQAFTVVGLVFGSLGAILWAIRSVLHRVNRERIGFGQAVLLISVPKETAEKKGEMERTKSLDEIREDISVAEALFSAIGGLRAERGIVSWFTGRSDNFSFEIVAHEGQVWFYVAVPRKMVEFTTQQIHALYPAAQVEDVEDYNLFSPTGAISGGYLVLKRHHLFPIKTFKTIEADPMEAITSALGRVEKGEGAAVQFIVRSARREWRKKGSRVAIEMQKGKSISDAFGATTFTGTLSSMFKSKPKEPQKERTLSPMEQEMQKSIQEKSSKAGVEVNIRVVASAANGEKSRAILNNLMNSFAKYNLYEFGNSLSKVVPGMRKRLVRDFIFRAFDQRRAAVFGAEEIASLFHFPLPTTETPNIHWLLARKAPPPVNAPAEGLVLGKAVYRGDETLIRIKREDRRRHVYVIGRSGVGKSVLIENMAVQDIENGEGVCVVDPHGDLVEAILRRIPKHRVDDVIVFDPSDFERPVGMNPLEVKSEEQKDFAVQEMIAIFYKLFPPEMIGPMFEHTMRNVMLTLMADPVTSGTIVEIPRMITDPDFQKVWVAKVKDPIVRGYWEKEVAKTSDFHKSEMFGYLVSKVGRFVENEMLRNIIGQQKSGFDLREVMDKKKILLVNLAKGKTGEVNANLLGLIIVSKLQMAALARADMPEAERHDFFLYIDEFQNFITDSIATILSEARKYRLCLIIAHQYMGQLSPKGDTAIRDAVLGNAGTILNFRIGIEDAEILEKEFAPTFGAYDLINVEKYTAYIKLLIDNTAAKPFNMQTIAPVKGDPKLAEAIKQLSRLKYGRDKALVEAEILERTQLGVTAAAPLPPIADKL
ncbi:hypothetical protein A3D72_02060 [Candidatus Uhrbacteria bacterium RIFCSPHIGHO2_02_FULL_57_19]|uniref:AAA+ ATPase domain-containing protein n=1 Tax=Candidatus Uhrbacteria bacterium RIFCSPHIGHO2_02_FULL_57_19 TaxID=1802391 RepID=A0A1F7U2W8_9BACT|nr:MAG: hypothetical protein A3D72_02060 [Candidatus Uhrbacteria bacterium RIFCSPHIGHO2_02_FULL_57_19]